MVHFFLLCLVIYQVSAVLTVTDVVKLTRTWSQDTVAIAQHWFYWVARGQQLQRQSQKNQRPRFKRLWGWELTFAKITVTLWRSLSDIIVLVLFIHHNHCCSRTIVETDQSRCCDVAAVWLVLLFFLEHQAEGVAYTWISRSLTYYFQCLYSFLSQFWQPKHLVRFSKTWFGFKQTLLQC